MELNSIVNDREKLATIRGRLSNIGWWMRCLCQHITIRANREDQECGRLWQSRFRAVRLLDEAAILACAAYVDLNPIRAGMAETLEESDFTSVQRRIQSLVEVVTNTQQHERDETRFAEFDEQPVIAGCTDGFQSETERGLDTDNSNPLAPVKEPTPATRLADRFLSPLLIDERRDPLGPDISPGGFRCSEKGFLAMPLLDYLDLLDWTARHIAPGKRSEPSARGAGLEKHATTNQPLIIDVSHFPRCSAIRYGNVGSQKFSDMTSKHINVIESS